MRVSREKMQEHRERVLDAAATLFRERGLDGIGVAEIMESVGVRVLGPLATSPFW